jgi:hypothetical protein
MEIKKKWNMKCMFILVIIIGATWNKYQVNIQQIHYKRQLC